MKNLAPNILRQRLLLEGVYDLLVDEVVIEQYFLDIAEVLGLRVYGEPIIHSPSGEGKEENQGYDAFVPLIDSGISLYVWSSSKFFSIIIYTCKAFDKEKSKEFTQEFFGAETIETMSF